jgi:diguanylate cyclase (GGDEF)-like protein
MEESAVRDLINENEELKRKVANLEERVKNLDAQLANTPPDSSFFVPDHIFRVDKDGNYTFANPPCDRRVREYSNQPLDTIVGRNYRNFHKDEESINFFLSVVKRVVESGKEERYEHRSEGGGIFERIICKYNDEEAIVISRDITQRKKLEEELSRAADHDYLTGLYNRRGFYSQLNSLLREIERGGKPFSIIYLDLDGLKNVNDQYGHEKGDALIKQVAKRLANCVRKIDVIGRLGGDEFSIIIRGSTNVEDIRKIVGKLGTHLNESYMLEGNIGLKVKGVSVGISLYGVDGTDSNLVDIADRRMYDAKRVGNSYTFGDGVIYNFQPRPK